MGRARNAKITPIEKPCWKDLNVKNKTKNLARKSGRVHLESGAGRSLPKTETQETVKTEGGHVCIQFKYFYMAVGILQSIDRWQIWQIILVALMTKGSRLLYKVPSETDKRKLIRKTK